MKKKILYGLIALVLPLYALADYSITTTADISNHDGGTEFGYDTTDSDQFAQSFTTTGAGTISTVAAYTKITNGTPSDHVVLHLYSDSGGLPGSDLGTSDGYTATGSCASHTFNFSSPVSVSAATQYWVVFTRDGGNNTNDYYSTCGAASTIGGQVAATYDHSTWTSRTKTRAITANVVEGGGAGGGSGTPPIVVEGFGNATTTCVALTSTTTQCVSESSTQSVDNPVQDLYFGFILFFMVFGGMIWFFRKK